MKNSLTGMSTETIIEKTILASVMDTGFWHRWMVHGIDEDFVKENKSKMINVKGWTGALETRALHHEKLAKEFDLAGDNQQAEFHYRKAGIYLNLAQWVFPTAEGVRAEWYKRCVEQFYSADRVSKDDITYHTLTIEGKDYEGRIRVPEGKHMG